MKVLRHLICVIAVLALCAPPALSTEKDTVIILHGIAKDSGSMSPVEAILRADGYKTLSITYPSTEMNLDGIAQHLRTTSLTPAFWAETRKVHIVTHSMGGLVARRYLDRYKQAIPADKMGRVIMLAPPNGGSEVADLIHTLPPYRWYYGPAGDELTTATQMRNKSSIYYDLGIIAGTKEWPYFVAAFVVPGSSDGRVSVKNTKISGMKDHITVSATHTFIMDKPDVHKQILRFLKTGAFDHEQ